MKLDQKPSSKVFDEKVSNDNIITVGRNNFSKLLSSEIGDEITVKRGRNKKIKLKIKRIFNPEHIYEELNGDVKITISKENFSIVKNLNLDDELIIRYKGASGEIVLKKLDKY